MSNIVLIGMPACGKSTVGVILAKETGKSFIDTDILIQEKEGQLLQDIINEKGNDYIRTLEKNILLELTCKNAVISTGGSAVNYPEAMEHLKKIGKVIYIKIKLGTVLERLNNLETRGVIMEKGETIKDIYNQRTPLYKKYADYVVQGDEKTVEDIIEEIRAFTAQ